MRILSVLLMMPLCIAARPVSYPGGWTFMTENNFRKHAGLIHYSPTKDFSLGYLAIYDRKKEYHSHFLNLNVLAKRWNNQSSQANLYLKSGVGAVVSVKKSRPRRSAASAYAGIAIDWEDRRFFTSYENRFQVNPISGFEHDHKVRLGIAPYIADVGEIHTWFMVQPEFYPKNKRSDKYDVSFIVRFFKKRDLLEVGITKSEKFMLNYIHRF